MNSTGIEQLTREARLLKVIAKVAPHIPAQAFRKHLALHVLVFRGRTPEQLERFAKDRYFAEAIPEQREREAKYIQKYQNLPE